MENYSTYFIEQYYHDVNEVYKYEYISKIVNLCPNYHTIGEKFYGTKIKRRKNYYSPYLW